MKKLTTTINEYDPYIIYNSINNNNNMGRFTSAK